MNIIFCEAHKDLRFINWRPLRSKHLTYAVATINGKQVLAHRLIAEIEGWDLDGKVVDHINGDGVDNRVENLQVVTQQQNMRKQRKPANCSSLFKGVNRLRDKWRARITVDGKTKSLGVFGSEREAAAAYNDAALELFGPFALLNNV